MSTSPQMPQVQNQDNDPVIEFMTKRINQMMDWRINCHGLNVEDLWRWAETDVQLTSYNSLTSANRYDGLSVNDRDNRLRLAADEWQSDSSSAKTFAKIQSALSLLFDRDPKAYCESWTKKYSQLTELVSAVILDSHKSERFKEKLKFHMFNAMLYGVAFGRTFIHETNRPVYFQDKKGKEKRKILNKCKEKFVNINTWNVWTDERARPDDLEDTLHDWFYRDIITKEEIIQEFGEKVFKEVEACDTHGFVSASYNGAQVDVPTSRTDVWEYHYYENKDLDVVIELVGGKVVRKRRLPGHKKLSLMVTMWNIRSGRTIFGVGIPEIMKQDKTLFDKFRNMNTDQAALSIYSTIFLPVGSKVQDSNISIGPGAIYEVPEPGKITEFKITPPSEVAIRREQMLASDMDEATGISSTVTGTADVAPGTPMGFIEMNRDAALQRLKLGLDNLLSMLSYEASIRWALIQELEYSNINIEKITDSARIAKAMEEYADWSGAYDMNEDGTVMTLYSGGREVKGEVEKMGNDWISSKKQNFFRVNPVILSFDGFFLFNAESVITKNKELDKQMSLDMMNMLLPLFPGDPQTYANAAKEICEWYHKDYVDIFPKSWIEFLATGEVPQPQEGLQEPQIPQEGMEPPTMIPGEPTPSLIPRTQTIPKANDMARKGGRNISAKRPTAIRQ